MPSSHRTAPQINALRRQAVELRLAGRSLADIRGLTGLSAPTIIAAHKAYLAEGWDGVDNGPRGRPGTGQSLVSPALQKNLIDAVRTALPPDVPGGHVLWSVGAAAQWLGGQLSAPAQSDTFKKLTRRLLQHHGLPPSSPAPAVQTLAHSTPDKGETTVAQHYWLSEYPIDPVRAGKPRRHLLCAHTPRGTAYWLPTASWPTAADWIDFLGRLLRQAPGAVSARHHNPWLQAHPMLREWIASHTEVLDIRPIVLPKVLPNPQAIAMPPGTSRDHAPTVSLPRPLAMNLTHLQRLEAESIHILREVVAEADKPVMLYSVGKDSAVMLHLARKAFYPAVPPFPLLHVDTRWKFREMYTFRDAMARELGMELIVHINPDGVAKDINPFTHGSAIHTDIMKTESLKQALDQHGFDVAFGGARRDEEKSRAKERVFSFRTAQHRWDPKNQRPELWKLYNARKHKGESIRVFPLSNWTELDIWQYIHLEGIPIVPLYYAAPRPVVERDGTLIMVDDERMPLRPGEVPVMRSVRFRTLGCYPLTGAIESTADTLPAIIQEMLLTATSERQGRVIDHDSSASMEKKKQEGYF